MNQSRFSHIDSLRGIAVLLVLWLHVSEVYIKLSPAVKEHGTLFYDYAWFINIGRIGVVIFFAISGFVLLKSIRGDRKTATRTFFTRRFFRLFPPYWVSVILGVFAMSLMGREIPFDAVVANITMLPQFFDKEMVLGLYWTLEAELFFYFIGWVLFLFTVLHKPINLFIVSGFFLSLFVVLNKFGYHFPQHIGLGVLPLHLSIMFWGGLFRIVYDNPQEKMILFGKTFLVKHLFIVLTFIILSKPLHILLSGFISDTFELKQFGVSYILGIVIFLLLATVLKVKNKFVVYIGTVSYSMYLFHPIVFYTLFWWLRHKAPVELTELHLGVYIFANIILALIVSSIVYYLVEKPSIDIAHKLTHYSKRKNNV